jgi:hypothetical protein
MKPFLATDEADLKQLALSIAAIDQQWSWIMLAIITLLYRLYCKARLVEIRKLSAAG